jgi:hypothetical protein
MSLGWNLWGLIWVISFLSISEIKLVTVFRRSADEFFTSEECPGAPIEILRGLVLDRSLVYFLRSEEIADQVLDILVVLIGLAVIHSNLEG